MEWDRSIGRRTNDCPQLEVFTFTMVRKFERQSRHQQDHGLWTPTDPRCARNRLSTLFIRR